MEYKYITSRFIPKYLWDWNINKDYENLSIVTYNEKTFISLKDVPVGIDISDKNYWLEFSPNIKNYVENCNTIINSLTEKIDTLENNASKMLCHFKGYINNWLITSNTTVEKNGYNCLSYVDDKLTFTAPKNGYYLLTGSITNNNTTVNNLYLYLNGEMNVSLYKCSNDLSLGINKMIKLNANDKLTFYSNDGNSSNKIVMFLSVISY